MNHSNNFRLSQVVALSIGGIIIDIFLTNCPSAITHDYYDILSGFTKVITDSKDKSNTLLSNFSCFTQENTQMHIAIQAFSSLIFNPRIISHALSIIISSSLSNPDNIPPMLLKIAMQLRNIPKLN